VDGASAIAQRFKIPELVVGLTIVAFGTSAPELVINIFASFEGKSEIAIGNILGSNMANVLLILGASAVASRVEVAASTAKYELPFSLIATVITGVLAYNFFMDSSSLVLSRFDGCLLLLLFGVFWIYTFRLSKKTRAVKSVSQTTDFRLGKSWFLVAIGIAGLFLGGKWVVDGAVAIARSLDISEGLIAITLVAVGTSLPELATSIVAARKKKGDIVTGNVIGSNIFNILWVLGLSSTIKPIPYQNTSNLDLIANLGAGLLMMICLVCGTKRTLTWKKGIIFLVVYAVYIAVSVKFRTL
jgi:cation:H+ antiporter